MRSITEFRLRRVAVRVSTGILAEGLLALVCFRLQLDLATASLFFLLAIVFEALDGGFLSSVVLSLAGAAFLDYFFVPPILTWRVASYFDLISLVTFAITSLVVTRLASKAREATREAERRRKNLEELYQTGQTLLSLEPDSAVIPRMLAVFRKIFALRAVCLFDGLTAELYREGESGSLFKSTRDAYIAGKDLDDSVSATAIRCLRSGGKVTGAIGFENLRDSDLAAASLATLAVTTLERAWAFESASRTAAEASAEVFRTAILDGLTHEFKTPLAIVMAAAGGIRESQSSGKEQQELAETIETEALRLSRLTSRLLRKAALDHEQVRPQMKHADIAHVVSKTVARHTHQPDDRRIQFEKRCDTAEAVIDEELLGIALTQLLDNAVKYSSPGSRILVTLSAGLGRIRIRVWNDGISVPRSERHRIFERFYRGEQSQFRTPGSGLGLYVARKIARAHGGTLDLDTENSHADSTTFCLTIPAVSEPQHADTIC